MSKDLARWLMDVGGPTIRYRTATELLGDKESLNVAALARNVLDSPPVKMWLARMPDVTPGAAPPNTLHGSKNTHFENVMAKLAQLGCRAGMAPLDEATAPWHEWLADQVAVLESGREPKAFVGTYCSMAAACLALAGYRSQAVVAMMRRRLGALSTFCRQGRYDIYVDERDYPPMPKVWRGRRPLIDPTLYASGVGYLPTIYDLYLLSALADDHPDENTRDRLGVVARYVLDPEYQRLAPGYGIVWDGRRRYYSAGWDCKLPGYWGYDALGSGESHQLVQRFALMAHLEVAHEHRWFRESCAFLNLHRTEKGTWRFPGSLIRESQSGYWVTGAYMGLEENRRRGIVREIESTFWMLRVEAMLGR